MATQNKSSNRSNRVGYSNGRVSANILANYHTNVNVIKNQPHTGGESEHNISIYDEGNASFIMDEGGNGHDG